MPSKMGVHQIIEDSHADHTMNPAQLLGLAVYGIIIRNWGGPLKLATIEEWIKYNANPNDYGRGYAGNHLSAGSGNAFVELHRQSKNGSFEIIASAFMDERQNPFATKAWRAKKIDSKLDRMFGHNQRVRIDV